MDVLEPLLSNYEIQRLTFRRNYIYFIYATTGELTFVFGDLSDPLLSVFSMMNCCESSPFDYPNIVQ